jgi:hypothetical protein
MYANRWMRELWGMGGTGGPNWQSDSRAKQ